MINETRHQIYIDLDCLLDTRMSVFRAAGVTGAELFGGEWYWTRFDNDPSGITQGRVTHDDFKKLWDARDNDVLEDTMPTLFCFELKGLVDEMMLAVSRLTNGQRIGVTVNVYPYIVSDLEAQILKRSIQRYTGMSALITIESIPYERMSLDTCRNRWSYMVVYNFEEWILPWISQLGVHPNDGFIVAAPRIAFNKPFVPVMHENEPVDPFTATSLMFSGTFVLNFLDISFYSVPLPSELPRGLKSSGSSISTPIRS